MLMLNLVLKILLLSECLNAMDANLLQSPCPKYFHYYLNTSKMETMAIIEIPSPPKGVPLMLRVILTVATIVQSNYLGRLELVRSKAESVRAILEGRSLLYRIEFPIQIPLPLLTGIALNNLQYCIGPRANGPIISYIYLDHTLYPPGILAMPSRFLNRTLTPSVSESTTTTSPLLNLKCGIAVYSTPLVNRGDKINPGQWPWLAGIFFIEVDFEYQCAGNLVSEKHIITVAHCLKLYGTTTPANLILVSLGRHFIEDWNEPGSFNMEVSEVRIHPDFKSVTNADADLALIILKKLVDFSPRIQPVCLWRGPIELEKIVGETGFVVGWGRRGEGKTFDGEPRITSGPIVSQEDCLRSNAAFLAMTSNRTFCAGKRNGSGPCKGDSGTGFIMLNSESERYHLRGIVSLSLLDRRTITCDLKQYIVYVDLAKHRDWIEKEISRDLQ